MPTSLSDVLSPIRTLPLPDDESRILFSRAVRLVKQRPDDFNRVGEWLDRHYSEGTLQALCERKYRQDFAYRLRLLRLDGTGNFALSTYKRRLALQEGQPPEQLKRETIEEARQRGYRLNGSQLVGRCQPNDFPDEVKVDESKVHLVWQDEDDRYRRRFLQIKAERRAAKLGEYDHPGQRDWRLGRAVGDILEAAYPATPSEHLEHSLKLVGIAALLVWPELMPVLGELGRWEWDSRADPSTEPTGNRWDDLLRAEAQRFSNGPHKRPLNALHPRSIGREEVLFYTPGEQQELQPQWGGLSSFRRLLEVAVDELEQQDSFLPATLAQDMPEESTFKVQKWLGRKSANVAIVFTDIVGSTLAEMNLGGEAYRGMRQAHFKRIRELIAKHDGIGIKPIGDGFLVLFRTSIEALDFSLALHQDTGHPNIKVRAGIHVGIVNEEDGDVYGSDVNLAARVSSAAKLDQIFLSDEAKHNIDSEKPQRFAQLTWKHHECDTKEGKITLWEATGTSQ